VKRLLLRTKKKKALRFLTGIYYATLVSHMVTVAQVAVPSKVDDVQSIIQSIRLAQEKYSPAKPVCVLSFHFYI